MLPFKCFILAIVSRGGRKGIKVQGAYYKYPLLRRDRRVKKPPVKLSNRHAINHSFSFK